MRHNSFVPTLRWRIHHRLSRWAGVLCNCQWYWVKQSLIHLFIAWYNIDLRHCTRSQVADYKSLNDFFLRTLKARKVSTCYEGKVFSPVDGFINQLGTIEKCHTLLQAKQKTYLLPDLVAGDKKLIEQFTTGTFAVFYLAPQDYHRVHMPLTAILQKTIYVPGLLFSVNPRNTARISQLFTRNERVVSVFRMQEGMMAIIQIGAFLVGKIGTRWTGVIQPAARQPAILRWHYHQKNIQLTAHEEMGHFQMGSTVILLFSKDSMTWNSSLKIGQRVTCGQLLGTRGVVENLQIQKYDYKQA